MALYAFDGTWNVDADEDGKDTNVVRFKELYKGHTTYLPGVGTRLGAVGRVAGGIFGAGGRSRVREMYDQLLVNWEAGDHDIDIIGFSRGAALAVHFANMLDDEGIALSTGERVHPRIRFLGLWDVVASFGLSLDTIIDFQSINVGWDVDTVPACVEHCVHAMALDERRESFRVVRPDDVVDPSALAKHLAVDAEPHVCRVLARYKYNWSGVYLEEGATYRFEVAGEDRWADAGMVCGPGGWSTDELPWGQEQIVRLVERFRRCPDANWFELIGAYGDEDGRLFRLGCAAGGQEYEATHSGEVWLFANDLKSKYDNNDGDLFVSITRIA